MFNADTDRITGFIEEYADVILKLMKKWFNFDSTGIEREELKTIARTMIYNDQLVQQQLKDMLELNPAPDDYLKEEKPYGQTRQ